LIRIKALTDGRGMLGSSKKESVMMNWPDWSAGWNDGYFGVHVVMHLVWYAIVIGLGFVLASYLMKSAGFGAGRPSALEVLKERYARGDLTKDDFDRMRKDILV
jgi:putative membrane protein